jgi:cobalamin biosynthesis protein CobD/CbiB
MFYDPPYVLLIAGLLAGITSGRAFEMTLRQAVQEWSKTKSTRTLQQLKGSSLTVPFVGICAGVCVFLASGLSIYGIPHQFSYAFSVPLTIGMAMLVWTQLQKLLVMLEEGGSRALDLDALE